MAETLLSIKGISKYFGGLKAVDGVEFDVYAGEIFGIIGPNGAGKTTIINSLMGLVPVQNGTIVFKRTGYY